MLFFVTNRIFPNFFLKNPDWLLFFLKIETEIFFVLLATCLGVSRLASLLLFCFFGVLSGFCGLRKNYFPFIIIYYWRLLFSLPFFLVCSIFLSANGVAVVIAFFLTLVSAVLFCCFYSPFAFLSLPFFRPLLLTIYLRLLHVLVVILGLFCPLSYAQLVS